ncbi:MAG: SDR family NAD(P)-dependent oxidoreductase [Marinilabiliales bacterium]|nr:SDR family NAD(P)-dependent oxidoreductase [Marinilabiliales bacterium]
MTKAVVIGASSGIGRELVLCCCRKGFMVHALGRRIEKLNSLKTEFPELIEVHTMDVTDEDSVRFLNRLFDAHPIDLVFHCAGVGALNPQLDFAMERETLDTNVTGFTKVVDLVFYRMVQQGSGHLVVITSVGGHRGNLQAPAYNASKAFQINYMEALSIRAAGISKAICVTDIRAGLTDTAMAKGEGLFWVASVAKVAKQIMNAVKRKKRVAYVTHRWGLIALLMRLLPFPMYRRLQ